MIKNIRLQLPPSIAFNDTLLLEHLATELGVPPESITGFFKRKESIDARNPRQLYVHSQLEVFLSEPLPPFPYEPIHWNPVAIDAPSVIIIGSGPAGLFAALQLIEKGIRPIILERKRCAIQET